MLVFFVALADPALTSASHARFVECLLRASYPLMMQ